MGHRRLRDMPHDHYLNSAYNIWDRHQGPQPFVNTNYTYGGYIHVLPHNLLELSSHVKPAIRFNAQIPHLLENTIQISIWEKHLVWKTQMSICNQATDISQQKVPLIFFIYFCI